ncbi:MAG: TPM domain-containing protein [Caulobacteraceae bacterium]
MASTQPFNDEGRARIAAAITKAEAATSGELFCIMTPAVSEYPETPIAWAAATALLAPPIALLAGADLLHLAGNGWSAGHVQAASAATAWAIGAYALSQAILFAVVALATSWSPLKLAVTPAWLKRPRVERAARQHFISTGLAAAQDRTGVLIFAALAEHRVEIIAHKDIHAAVGDAVWKAAADAVVAGMKSSDPASGFVKAIEICGEALALHFPRTGSETNDFPDALVEI